MSVQEKLTTIFNKYFILDGALSLGLYLAAVVMLLYPLKPPDLDAIRRTDRILFSSPTPIHFCALNNFDKSSAPQCLHARLEKGKPSRILFLGDETVTPLFKIVGSLAASGSSVKSLEKQNETVTDAFSGMSIKHIYVDSVLTSAPIYDEILKTDAYPDVLVYGTGMKDIKITADSKLDLAAIQDDVSVIISSVKEISKKTLVLWTPTFIPQDSKLSDQIEKYNGLVKKTLAATDVIFWPFLPLMDIKAEVQENVQYYRGQLIVEWLCNIELRYTYNSCFTVRFSKLTLPVFICILLVGGVLLQYYLKKRYMPGIKDQDKVKKINHIIELSKCIINIFLIMAYFHFCDREPGNGVQKEEKEYSNLKFFIPLAIIGAVGYFTSKKTDDVTVLNRYQSDDWKGWMQLVILVYHFTGASKMLPIYFIVRLLVTSYLFLNGYGQFTFFFLKGNFGWMRLSQTFVRLNFLVVLLCLVMNRQYQFYYFVPLVSFWFVVIYSTMGIWPQINVHRIEASTRPWRLYLVLVLKLILLILIIIALALHKRTFDAVFGNIVMAPFFTSGNTITEWTFRWNLDRFSVVAGMLFALAYEVLGRMKILRETADTVLCNKIIYYIVTLLSFALIGAQVMFAALCSSKFDCNRAYSYFGALPVLGYVLLRNLHPACRSSYSTAFAWCGKISLELFIAQYHIWLADDTKKILVLIPGYPVLNFILITYIFVSISHEIQRITSFFASYFIPRKVQSTRT